MFGFVNIIVGDLLGLLVWLMDVGLVDNCLVVWS